MSYRDNQKTPIDIPKRTFMLLSQRRFVRSVICVLAGAAVMQWVRLCPLSLAIAGLCGVFALFQTLAGFAAWEDEVKK